MLRLDEAVVVGERHALRFSQRLLELGCTYGQGYHFARPMPACELRALLEPAGVEAPLPR